MPMPLNTIKFIKYQKNVCNFKYNFHINFIFQKLRIPALIINFQQTKNIIHKNICT